MVDSTPGRAALLSLHPRFASAILAGEKTVELRRSAFADDVSHMVVYCTAPMQRVVGWFAVEGIDRDRPSMLWRRHRDATGVTAAEFKEYFLGTDTGAAIKVGDVSVLTRPASLDEIGPMSPPQSYSYMEPGHFHRLRRRKTAPVPRTL